MCDTLVALGNSTHDGSVIFAKNSDRQPNEPHIMVRIPRRKHDPGSGKYLKATYIEIPQVEETFDVVLLKPSWIWGCEMGWNEYGLNIGNEAVFTKEKKGRPCLIGMDMVRLALERCKTSEEAVDLITGLLQEYGQGGNCGYEKPFTYHNSFLIADKKTAWVLETAGIYWAAKQVRDVYCISNCLTIENDFDKSHPDVVKHAVEKGWCRNEKDFSFARCYGDKLYTHFSRARTRREICEKALNEARGRIDTELVKSVLRSHHPELDGKLFRKNSVRSVCMHAGGVIGDHTTGSYIASLREDLCTYWVTGASTPCISVFKPLWMTPDAPLFPEEEQQRAVDYWMKREKVHRNILMGRIDLWEYLEKRDQLEKHIYEEVLEAQTAKSEEALSDAMKNAFSRETEFVEEQLASSGSPGEASGKAEAASRNRGVGGLYYRWYWNKQTRKLG